MYIELISYKNFEAQIPIFNEEKYFKKCILYYDEILYRKIQVFQNLWKIKYLTLCFFIPYFFTFFSNFRILYYNSRYLNIIYYTIIQYTYILVYNILYSSYYDLQAYYRKRPVMVKLRTRSIIIMDMVTVVIPD